MMIQECPTAIAIKDCPICSSPAYTYAYDCTRPAIHAERGIPGMIRRCTSCGMLYKETSVQPTEVYDEAYAESFQNLAVYAGAEPTVTFFRRVLSDSLQRVKQQPPRLLDIGCGVGTLLAVAADLGCDVAGVEISAPLAQKASERGYQVFAHDVAELHTDSKYDIITMMDIIEHLYDPGRILRELRQRLQPGGELIVYTPNHASMLIDVAGWMYRLGRKSAVENIFASSHTCFFTARSLEDLLTRNGYRIVASEFALYDTERPGQEVSAKEQLAIRTIESVGRLLGYRGFRMIYHASPV